MNYLVTKIGLGELHVMAAPQSRQLANHIKYLKMQGITKVLSLLRPNEAKAYQLEDEEKWVVKEGLTFENFPIEDHSVPLESELKPLAKRLLSEIKQGEKLVIHCFMGVGRTGITSCAVLMENGLSAEEAMALVTEKRQLNVPETLEQVEFIRAYFD